MRSYAPQSLRKKTKYGEARLIDNNLRMDNNDPEAKQNHPNRLHSATIWVYKMKMSLYCLCS